MTRQTVETTPRKKKQVMTMTDPIADMLTRVRNANQAYHDTAMMPHSKIKVGIAEILGTEGYIAGYEVNDPAEGEVGKTLSITLKYGAEPRALDRRRPADLQARPAGVREVDRPAQGARRPGDRDHLDVPGSADRQAGPPHKRGRRSRRLRLVTARQQRGTNMSRIGRLPIAVPSGVEVDPRRPAGFGQGPEGHAAAHASPSRSPSRAAESGELEVTRPDDERDEQVAARPDPDPGVQHGHRRHRRLREEARDRRRRLPRHLQGPDASSSSRSASATRSR